MILNRLRRQRAPWSLLTLITFGLPLLQARPAGAQEPQESTGTQQASEPDMVVGTPLSDPNRLRDVVGQESGQPAVSSENLRTPASETTGPVQRRPESVADQVESQQPFEPHQPDVSTLALPTGDKSGVTNKTLSLPSGSGTVQGMGESFSAQLSTGIATFSVPFALLPGRGVAPSLGLQYSSSGAHGIAGVGWSVEVPFIARQTDRGIPEYDDQGSFHPDQDRFLFNGGQELVPICVVGPAPGVACTGALINAVTGRDPLNPGTDFYASEVMPAWAAGWHYFRPRLEGSYQRFFWSPDRRTWRVQDQSGTSMELGVPLDGKNDEGALESNPDNRNQIYSWHLARQYDAHGQVNAANGNPTPVNVAVYKYVKDGGKVYLSDIFDTTPQAQSTTDDLRLYAHHTRLSYETRRDPTESFRSGWKIQQRLRLRSVAVTSKTFNSAVTEPRRLVRRYHLSYDPSSHVSLLSSVQLEGRCGGSESDAATPAEGANQELPANKSCPRQPAMRFGYARVAPYTMDNRPAGATLAGYEGFDERLRTIDTSPPHSLDEELTELFDVNSDALPDVLVTAPGVYGQGHGVFFSSATSFGAAQPIGIRGVLGANASTITLRNVNVASLDVDGDAAANLLHMPTTKQYAIYRAQKEANRWVWSGSEVTTADRQSAKINFTRDAADTRTLDVNFDGLVDVVITSGTEVQTFFSLGRYPGGHGQFGNADWTGPHSARISNEPVRTCVPWSGSPVRFSDRDIKLADMNGDGITDIVRVQRGDIRYWPGRGDGVWGTGSRLDCAAGSFGANRHVSMSTSPQYSDIQADSLRVDDVNGDGLADLVQVRFDQVDMWLNIDGVGWTQRHIIRGTPASPSHASRVRLTDVNGSGTPDILWGNQRKYQYIDLQGGGRPWVLTSVENGLGKTTTLEYTTSVAEMLAAENESATEDDRGPWSKRMPISVHVVKRVTDRDNLQLAGRAGGAYVTEYTYRDPVFEGRQREFRGFERVRVRKIGDTNSPTDVTKSVFLLGECTDFDPRPDVDTCDAEHRYMPNPRDAVKGMPLIVEQRNEQGVYVRGTHNSYRPRRLYVGMDGRDVRHTFALRVDSHVYDTQNFTAYLSYQQNLHSITTGAANEPIQMSMFPGRGTHTLLTNGVQIYQFGNQVDTTTYGCLYGTECPVRDEIIVKHANFGRPTNDTSGWLWRSVRSWVVVPDATIASHTSRRNDTRSEYDAAGNLTKQFAIRSGTIPLNRKNAANVAHAPAPLEAAADGEVQIQGRIYDSFGNLTEETGPNGRCRRFAYDALYAQFATSETVHAGGAPPFATGFCGPKQLATGAAYDRALGKLTVFTDANMAATLIAYDDFGRQVRVARPNSAGVASIAKPSVKTSYFLPDVTGKPYSVIHTQTEDSPAEATPQIFQESWSVVDGLGRTLVTLTEAETAGQWIASKLTEFDGKGASARTYLPFRFTSNLSESADGKTFTGALPVSSSTPVSAYTATRYDAFGRTVQRIDSCGQVELQQAYQALSAHAWDKADLAKGTYTSERKDGHGRRVGTIERVGTGGTEQRLTETQYLPTGEPEIITRKRGSEVVVRWIRYDSHGRMVLNVEPNTSANFDPNPNAAIDDGTAFNASGLRAWRYAYNHSGDLVGTSDARGCGANFVYDSAGRLIGEDYSPCQSDHVAYSTANVTSGANFEVLYGYDDGTVPAGSGLVAPPSSAANGEPAYAAGAGNGRLVSVHDRASSRWSRYDARGRLTMEAVKVAAPTAPPNGFTGRYAARWYYRGFAYDQADREQRATTGATVAALRGSEITTLGSPNYDRSVVTTTYGPRGTAYSVQGSYDTLVASTTRTSDGLLEELRYGDVAQTTSTLTYDCKRRLGVAETDRVPPAIWSSPPANYLPAPTPGAATPSSFQITLQFDSFTYDDVSNPIEVADYRVGAEWPAGAKPVKRSITYDDRDRVTGVTYEHADDNWVSPFHAENQGADDPRRARPSPHVSFPKRIKTQSFEYDWLGNTSVTGDDAKGFYDRSLGTITNGSATSGPYRMVTASNASLPSPASSGQLTTVYDATGNVIGLSVQRTGTCLPTGSSCSQRFAYAWDEVGRLVRARRWDVPTTPYQPASAALPAAIPNVDLRYVYDGTDQRIIKTAIDAASAQVHSVYVFDTLELRRAAFSTDYVRDENTEVPYLFANNVRLGRVSYEDTTVPTLAGARAHVFLELSDHLGSSSMAIDKATSELVERTTYQVYGGAESSYRPARWDAFREDHRFTGKEEDIEVGLTYFGKRFYSAHLGRWMSPDPLGIHVPTDGDPNLYAYAKGRTLASVDPDGLNPLVAAAIGGAAGGAIDAAFQLWDMHVNKTQQDFNWGSFGASVVLGATGTGVGEVLSVNLAKAAASQLAKRGASTAVQAAARTTTTVLTGGVTTAAFGQVSSGLKRDGFQMIRDSGYHLSWAEPTGPGASWQGMAVDFGLGALGSGAGEVVKATLARPGLAYSRARDALSRNQLESQFATMGQHPNPLQAPGPGQIAGASKTVAEIGKRNEFSGMAMGAATGNLLDTAEERRSAPAMSQQPGAAPSNSNKADAKADRGVQPFSGSLSIGFSF